MEELLPRGLEHEVGEHLLVDRVADLHGAAAFRLALTRQFDARKGSAVDAVAAGAAAGHHDEIARMHGGIRVAPGHDPHRAAEHERVADVARMEGDGAGDRGDAHAVAIVTDPCGHAREQPLRMDDPRGNLIGRRVGRGHAEHVEVGDRLGTQARAKHVADHAAKTRRRATIRLDR